MELANTVCFVFSNDSHIVPANGKASDKSGAFLCLQLSWRLQQLGLRRRPGTIGLNQNVDVQHIYTCPECILIINRINKFGYSPANYKLSVYL